MLATQNVLNDDVQQDLLQRTQRWLDILEARTLAFLAATDPETLTPAERETSIHRYLQLTARFLQLRQKASKTSNPKPDYNPWLDQILGDPQPNDLPPFDPNSHPPLEEEEVDGSPLSTPELPTESRAQEPMSTDSPSFNLNSLPTTLPDHQEASDSLPDGEEREADVSRSEVRVSASPSAVRAANVSYLEVPASQVLDRWPSAIIRPQPEVDWLSSDF